MCVNIRIRPLIDRVGCTGAILECSGLTIFCGEVHVLRGTIQRVIVGQSGIVDVRDHINGSRFNLCILFQNNAGHMTRRFVGMSAAQNNKGTSLFFTFQYIYIGIADGAFQVWIITAQLKYLGHIRTSHDVFLEMALGIKARTGNTANESRANQNGNGGQIRFLHFHSPSLLDQEDPQQQRN